MAHILSKKGMGVGQVFVFIITAITFAMVMFFGYDVILKFIHRGEQVEFVQFKTDLESSVRRIYTEYGSVRIKQYSTPAKHKQICFVNMDHQPSEAELQTLCNKDLVACDVWQEAWNRADKNGYEAVDENVFIKPPPETGAQIKVYKISISGESQAGFLCEKIVNGRFSLRLEGKGDRTELSKVVSE